MCQNLETNSAAASSFQNCCSFEWQTNFWWTQYWYTDELFNKNRLCSTTCGGDLQKNFKVFLKNINKVLYNTRNFIFVFRAILRFWPFLTFSWPQNSNLTWSAQLNLGVPNFFLVLLSKVSLKLSKSFWVIFLELVCHTKKLLTIRFLKIALST